MPADSSTLTLPVPAGFELRRVVCSYGYFILHPNHWDVANGCLGRTLTLANGRLARVVVDQPQRPRLRVRCARRLDTAERAEVKRQVTRMLRVSEDQAAWRRVIRIEPALARRRYGRMFRSPTLFEDIVKTITSCNVTWGNTITMNRRLCREVGGGGFPSPQQVADFGAEALRERCGVGYRAERIHRMARGFLDGSVAALRLEDPARPTDAVLADLLSLNGIGPYAAGNICQLLGRYDCLAIDSETYRHYAKHHGVTRPGTKDAAGLKKFHARIEAHYARFQPFAFKAYWFELWSAYEAAFGRAWTWDRETTGTQFTAAVLNR